MDEFKGLVGKDAGIGQTGFKIRGTPFEIVYLKKTAEEIGCSENETARLALSLGMDLAKVYVEWRDYVMKPVQARLGGLTDGEATAVIKQELFSKITDEVQKLVRRLDARLEKVKEKE